MTLRESRSASATLGVMARIGGSSHIWDGPTPNQGITAPAGRSPS
jgi:hypothetical protein